jgi:hypothetical protein
VVRCVCSTGKSSVSDLVGKSLILTSTHAVPRHVDDDKEQMMTLDFSKTVNELHIKFENSD